METTLGATIMCRNIKALFNFDPPATDEEVRDAALQFVRKLSGYHHPSMANEAAFNQAIDEVAHAARHLLDSLVTDAEPKNREEEAAKAHERALKRFGPPQPHTHTH
jgi:hypothetical protein